MVILKELEIDVDLNDFSNWDIIEAIDDRIDTMEEWHKEKLFKIIKTRITDNNLIKLSKLEDFLKNIDKY